MPFSLQDMIERRRKLAVELATLDHMIEVEALRLAGKTGGGMVPIDEERIDLSMFKDTTRRLLVELWDAPEKMISKEDIRVDVMFDDEASDEAVKMVIRRARQEIEAHSFFPYEIATIPRKGYRLVSPKR